MEKGYLTLKRYCTALNEARRISEPGSDPDVEFIKVAIDKRLCRGNFWIIRSDSPAFIPGSDDNTIYVFYHENRTSLKKFNPVETREYDKRSTRENITNEKGGAIGEWRPYMSKGSWELRKYQWGTQMSTVYKKIVDWLEEHPYWGTMAFIVTGLLVVGSIFGSVVLFGWLVSLNTWWSITAGIIFGINAVTSMCCGLKRIFD